MTFDTMVGVFFLLAALVLWELETMRKDAARVRVVMEREAEIRERGYKCIESIQRMLASEIQRQRHSRGGVALEVACRMPLASNRQITAV